MASKEFQALLILFALVVIVFAVSFERLTGSAIEEIPEGGKATITKGITEVIPEPITEKITEGEGFQTEAAAARCTTAPCSATATCSRYSLPAETNGPNTIDSCNDGSASAPNFACSGSPYVDSITISEAGAPDGDFDEGEPVSIASTVYCLAVTPWRVYYTNNEASPSWAQIGIGSCTPPSYSINIASYALAAVGVTRYHSFRVALSTSFTGACAGTTTIKGDNDDISIQVNAPVSPAVSCSVAGTSWTFPSGAPNDTLKTSDTITVTNNGTAVIDVTGQLTSSVSWMYTSEPGSTNSFDVLHALIPRSGPFTTHDSDVVAYPSNTNKLASFLPPGNLTEPLKLFIKIPVVINKSYSGTYEITCSQSVGGATGVIITPNQSSGIRGAQINIPMTNAGALTDPVNAFSDLVLIDSAGTRFDATALQFTPGSPASRNFKVPLGAATGTAYLLAIGTSAGGSKESATKSFTIT
jgi:hypothetical protein